MAADKTFTVEELQSLKDRSNIHLLIHGKVYAITEFLDEHPGGDEVLFSEAGKDATEAFEDVGHSDESRELLEKYLVGNLAGGAKVPKGASAQDAGATPNSTKTPKQTKTDYSFLLPLAILGAWMAYRYFDKANSQASGTGSA